MSFLPRLPGELVSVCADPNLVFEGADPLARIWESLVPIRLDGLPVGTLAIEAGEGTNEEESFRWCLAGGRLTIWSESYAGAMRGGALLLQGLALGAIPMQGEAAPGFEWRGMHLDVSRHFFGVETVLRFLDLLALYGFNRFHWHLVDDQGWRIEIRRYPMLTGVGAWRTRSMRVLEPPLYEETPHGGFYSQAQIREVVAHAAALGIEVIPEIELPGHSAAALAAYPEHGNDPKAEHQVGDWWGVYKQVYSPRASTLEFLKGILEEVCDLFPGRYVHIGGDECPKDEWRVSPEAQAIMAEHLLADEDALQSWFIQQIGAFLSEKGKVMVGWDEILEGGIPPGATVMSWRGEEGGIEAARSGHPVVMTPWRHTYFDHYSSRAVCAEPHSIGGCTTWTDVAAYNVIPADLEPEWHGQVLGAQGQLWTEYTPDEATLWHKMFPRAIVLAERLWNPDEPLDAAALTKWLAAHAVIHEGIGFGPTDLPAPVTLIPYQSPMEFTIWLDEGRWGLSLGLQGNEAVPAALEGVTTKFLRIGGAERLYWTEFEIHHSGEHTFRLVTDQPLSGPGLTVSVHRVEHFQGRVRTTTEILQAP